MKTSTRVGFVKALGAMLALSLLSGCTFLVGSWAGNEPTTSHDQIRFSHYKHVVDEEAECSQCHTTIASSTSLDIQRELPKEESCMDCHDRDDDCAKCHSRPKAAAGLRGKRMKGLIFSHAAHLKRKDPDGKESTCATCHPGVSKTTTAQASGRPEMFNACGSCHRTTFDRDHCSRCHRDMVGTEVRPTSLYDHGAGWDKRHGLAAKGGSVVCAHCHTAASCNECHNLVGNPLTPSKLNLDRVDANFHHRGDWLSRHAIEAKLDNRNCLSCHNQRQCVDCHTKWKIASTKRGQGNPHPVDWLARGGKSFHGDDARRDPLSCAACHDRGAASNCVLCHKVGGPGGNPHPSNWSSTLDKKTATACAPCHN